MTRPSKRELERKLEELGDGTGSDGPDTIVLEETIVGSAWSAEDGESASSLDAGQTRTETTELTIGGEGR